MSMPSIESFPAERAVPFYCPYCGEEDLEPQEADGHSTDCNEPRPGHGAQFHGARPHRTDELLQSLETVGVVPCQKEEKRVPQE